MTVPHAGQVSTFMQDKVVIRVCGVFVIVPWQWCFQSVPGGFWPDLFSLLKHSFSTSVLSHVVIQIF